MALIRCNECNNQVSDQAEACPECGAPVAKWLSPPKPQLSAAKERERDRAVGILGFLVIGFLIFGLSKACDLIHGAH
jgi:hypothetical protein